MTDQTGSGYDRDWFDRRRAMIALAAAGGGFALLGTRWSERPRSGDRLIPWPQVASLVVRFPVRVDTGEVVCEPAAGLDPMSSRGADAPGTLLRVFPVERFISWTPEGVRTRRASVEVVRILRQRIVDDFSNGRLMLARGWILAETEWCLLQLAALRPA